MHELGLAEETLRLALAEAERQGGHRIHAFHLEVGSFSGVVADALRFALETIITGTPAEGAQIAIDEIPAVGYCTHCARTFAVDGPGYACPRCGRICPELIQGRELRLVSMKVS